MPTDISEWRRELLEAQREIHLSITGGRIDIVQGKTKELVKVRVTTPVRPQDFNPIEHEWMLDDLGMTGAREFDVLDERKVRKRMALDVRQMILFPTLNQILRHHRREWHVSASRESRLTIGTWEGELPLFRKGENRLLIPKGQSMLDVPAEYEEGLHKSYFDPSSFLMDRSSRNKFDSVFLLNPHAFLKPGNDTVYAQEWARHCLKPGGVAVSIFADIQSASPVGTYGHYLLSMDPTAQSPREYERYLQQCGILHYALRSVLTVSATSGEGRMVLRNLLKILLPPALQDHEEEIQKYEEGLQKRCQGKFHYALYFLVSMLRDPAEPFFASSLPSTHKVQSRENQTPIQQSEGSDSTQLPYSSVYEQLSSMTPKQKLELMTFIADKTGGEEYLLDPLLKAIGLPRAEYLKILDTELHLEHIARLIVEFEYTGKVPTVKPMPREVADYVVGVIIADLTENSTDLQTRLNACGLSRSLFETWRRRLLGETRGEKTPVKSPIQKPRLHFRPEPSPWDTTSEPPVEEALAETRREVEEEEQRKAKRKKRAVARVPKISIPIKEPSLPEIDPRLQKQNVPIPILLLQNHLAILRTMVPTSTAEKPSDSEECLRLLQHRLSLLRTIAPVSGEKGKKTMHSL